MSEHFDDLEADLVIAASMRGDNDIRWPMSDPAASALLVERIIYHGVAGLLAEQGLKDLPSEIAAPIRDQALAQAMWEIRHRYILGELLEAFGVGGVSPLVLKGTALAYDLYTSPSARARGDTDLLVAQDQVAKCQDILASLGFACESGDGSPVNGQMQEIWSRTDDDGPRHDIDLHWQVMNAPTLENVLPFGSLIASARKLPGLHNRARGIDHVNGLIHAAAHHAMSVQTPYVVGDVTYYGGSRFIWARDIDLLAAALDTDDWEHCYRLASDYGLGPVLLNGLTFAKDVFGTRIPVEASERFLATEPMAPESAYLLHDGQAKRAVKDFLAIKGWRARVRFLRWRLLPSSDALRAKYPRMASRPLIVLYVRRIIELFRPRPEKVKQ